MNRPHMVVNSHTEETKGKAHASRSATALKNGGDHNMLNIDNIVKSKLACKKRI